MAWWIEARQIAAPDGNPTGRWRMTATSDEDGGGPFGDLSHDHASPEEAELCDKCDEFVSQVSGFPSKRQSAMDRERHERAELSRLKDKYGEFGS